VSWREKDVVGAGTRKARDAKGETLIIGAVRHGVGKRREAALVVAPERYTVKADDRPHAPVVRRHRAIGRGRPRSPGGMGVIIPDDLGSACALRAEGIDQGLGVDFKVALRRGRDVGCGTGFANQI
jgi:hypothetical protein